jgi:2-oxoglutarate dehydrogenase E1 component
MAQTATVQIQMPEMGESVTEGIVLEWHVAEGDFVNEGDTVVEVSTDKVDAEVPAPAAGVITKLLVQVDDEVPVGAPLAEMEPGDDAGAGSSAGPAGPVAAGDSPPPPAVAEASSGEGPPTAPPAGQAAEADARGTDRQAGDSGNGADVRATPIARRVAAENGVDLGAVAGTGPGAKVTKDDVLGVANGGGDGAAPAAAPAAPGEAKALRGPAAMLAQAMDQSREVPTATSFRTIAVDTLGEAKGPQRDPQRAGDEDLLHPPDRLGDRPGGQ